MRDLFLTPTIRHFTHVQLFSLCRWCIMSKYFMIYVFNMGIHGVYCYGVRRHAHTRTRACTHTHTSLARTIAAQCSLFLVFLPVVLIAFLLHYCKLIELCEKSLQFLKRNSTGIRAANVRDNRDKRDRVECTCLNDGHIPFVFSCFAVCVCGRDLSTVIFIAWYSKYVLFNLLIDKRQMKKRNMN